ncbi:Hypothetical protein NTJ_15501 [Nesidiocoris tenuis]|uniref:Uncharacterized protein n=1 Tax=Nesidiocoris tenuis TaxID=355587 RepID=A0ABN7BE88_9HEMI|nr:Hypothetical protein NTJ_15501 [Nesidiocoris tenuis]
MTPPAKDVFSRKADDCVRRKVMGDDRLIGEKGMELQRPASLKGAFAMQRKLQPRAALESHGIFLLSSQAFQPLILFRGRQTKNQNLAKRYGRGIWESGLLASE